MQTPKSARFFTKPSDHREPIHRNRTAAHMGWRPCAALCLLAAVIATAQPAHGETALRDFTSGLPGWSLRPGNPGQVELIAGRSPERQAVRLRPEGKLLGLESERLPVTPEPAGGMARQVQVSVRNEGLTQGVFAVSLYCYDAANKSLGQIVFHSLKTTTAPHDWRRVRGEFGAGTAHPLPEGTVAVALRFSFHEPSGDCRGTVSIDAPTIAAKQAAWPGWPAEIVADVGELQVRFESRSFWTLYRIDYRGTRLGLDRFGSHYGSVANFPGVGFIGSGHTENEDERVLKLKLVVDGRDEPTPAAMVRAQSCRLEKTSRLRSLLLESSVEVADGRIVEDVRLRAEQPTPVTLIYHFMHPWTDTATEYLAELPDGRRIEGPFDGDKGQKIDKATRWSAIYDAPTGKGAVTCVLAAPADDDWRTRYWDITGRYRKHYFVTFLNKTVPADRTFHYRLATIPFAAEPSQWKAQAARVADREFHP